MSAAWATFRECGGTAWVILWLGIAGAAFALAALVLGARRARGALPTAILAVALGAACAFLGYRAAQQRRRASDRETVSLRAVQRERLQREGWRRARSVARVGLAAAVPPLLLGCVALFVARRRRVEDSDAPFPLPLALRLLPRVVVAAAGLAFAAPVVECARGPLPGRDFPPDDPVWDVFDGVAALEAAHGVEVIEACRRLGPAVERAGDRAFQWVDLTKIEPRCVESWLAYALGAPPTEGLDQLEELTKSYFVRSQPALEQLVQEKLVAIPPSPPPDLPASSVTAGEPILRGDLAPAALESALVEAMPRIRRCYASSNAVDDGVEGAVRMRFYVDWIGEVYNASEETALLGPDLRSCVVRVVDAMPFPRRPRNRAPVEVVLPLRFAPVKAD